MLAKVLNSARAANILDENDSGGVKGLIADYFATVPAVEGEDAVDGEDESDQDDIEMVSESRRDVKTSNGDSQENCDIDISDDEGLVGNCNTTTHPTYKTTAVFLTKLNRTHDSLVFLFLFLSPTEFKYSIKTTAKFKVRYKRENPKVLLESNPLA